MPDVGFRVDGPLHATLVAEAGRQGTSVSEVVRTGLQRAYSVDRPTYGHGSRHSFVFDSWSALTSAGDPDAPRRLNAFRAELAEGRAEFALTTGNANAVIPPGYQPTVPEVATDQPLRALCRVEAITSSTPFTLPFGPGVTSATAVHVENVAPTAGTFTVGTDTVSPSGISGIYDISRELVDSSSPAVDTVVMSLMLEDYHRKTEAAVAAELTRITAGAIANGQVPSGAQVATTTAGTLVVDLKKLIARSFRLRRRVVQAIAATADVAYSEALGTLDETTGDSDALWRPNGVPVALSADLVSTVGATAVVGASPASVWAWESGPLSLRYEEVQGPAVIRLALFGYFAARVLRPVGVAALRAA